MNYDFIIHTSFSEKSSPHIDMNNYIFKLLVYWR